MGFAGWFPPESDDFTDPPSLVLYFKDTALEITGDRPRAPRSKLTFSLTGDLSYVFKSSVSVQEGGGVLVFRRHVDRQFVLSVLRTFYFNQKIQGGHLEFH